MINVRAALGYALSSGANLRMKAERHGPADVVTALGMVRPNEAITVDGGIEDNELARFAGLASQLLRVKWGQDGASLPELIDAAVEFVRFHFGRKGWHINDRKNCTAEETLRRFAQQVIDEACFSDKCRVCSGRKFIYNELGKAGVCKACGGSGLRPEPGRARARALKMSPEAYRERWQDRFRFILSEVGEIERKAISKMRSKLVDP